MSEQKLAPCPKCPLCSEEMTDISQVAEKTMFECGNEDCDLVGVWITGERIDARPDLRRIAELEEELAKLKESVAFIISSEPAHDGSGGLYIEHFDGEGNPVGAESVDPIGLLGWIYDKAKTALHEAT